MKFVVDDCMDAVLGDTQLNGSATRLSAMMILAMMILAMVSCVVTVTGLPGRGCLPDSLSRLNSAAYISPCCVKGNPPLVRCSWISLGVKPLRPR